jgi:cation diffusion facilitator CzcD-associated flavoprotein CzcO
MHDHDPKTTSVVIIGAGHSGLAAAYELKQRGIPVRMIERASQVGAAWRGRHPQLRLNTHRALSGLPGLPMPKNVGPFPHRDSVIRYLEDYAAFIGVPIDFGVSATKLHRADRGWTIETDAGLYLASHVVIATGNESVAWMPEWPGRETFEGELIHSGEFGALDRYRGKRVLVVGAGNSGTDILNHLSRIITERLWVSIRHGPVIFPTWLLGVPIQRLAPLFELLPLPAVDRMLEVTERVAFGKLSRWGMKRHPVGGATRLVKTGTAPAIDNGFVSALKAGRVQVVPEIAAFEGHAVRLADGQTIKPDIVIAATGYRTGLEEMIGHLGILDETGVPTIHGDEQDPSCPGLWVTGMRPRLVGLFVLAGRTGSNIADAIALSLRKEGQERRLSVTASDELDQAA